MVRILRRGEWGATGPWGPPMDTPSRGCWIHHSTTSPTSDPRADMRTLERIGKQRFGRLSYSFAVHPSGAILEGQANRVGAHTRGQNSTSHGLVAIGNYDTTVPPPVMIEAFRNLFHHGADQGWWQPVLLGGHRNAPGASTACPGRHLYARLDDITKSHEEDDVLKRGDSGSEVRYVQEQVNRVLTGRHDTGPLKLDGDYGPSTEKAVKDAQQKLGWKQTGQVHAAFSDRMLHVVLYGDMQRLELTMRPA